MRKQRHSRELLERIKLHLWNDWFTGRGRLASIAIHCSAKDVHPLLKLAPPHPPKRSYYGPPGSLKNPFRKPHQPAL